MNEGVQVRLHALASALDVSQRPASHSIRLILEERTLSIHWLGSRGGLEEVMKRIAPAHCSSTLPLQRILEVPYKSHKIKGEIPRCF
jgi:hypothetical protein